MKRLPTLLWTFPLLLAASPGPAAAQGIPVYFGTYTRGGASEGIYVSQLDLESGALSEPKLAAKTPNPSFLALHPDGGFLYAVSEMETVGGMPGGAVGAFSVDPESGLLTLLNQEPSIGAGPCHLVLDRESRNVLVANYGGGSVAVLPINADGTLQKASSFIQHEGSSVDTRRQQGPHAHSVNVDAAGRFAVVADLGLDKVLVYKFDSQRGKLTPNEPPGTSVAPGAGPRHFAFHPDGRRAYVINEIHSSVTAFDYDAERGTLTERQTISTLPEGFEGNNSTAEVQVHPSGRFLYGSNRGHDSIAMFSIGEGAGELAALGHQPTGGRTPRNFAVDPTGKWLLAANQGTNNVVVFRIDQESGRLSETGHQVSVGAPVCVKMLPPAQ